MTIHPPQLLARTRSVDETWALAGALAEVVQPSDLILLAGELGAGKTAFVQGLGRALGVTQPVTSPTFALAQRYEGKLVLHHLDVYRLDQLHEVHDLGVGELLDEGGVVMVEWGDVVLPALPKGHLEVRLTYGETIDERDLVLRTVGGVWTARCPQLAEAIAPWRVDGTDPADEGSAAC